MGYNAFSPASAKEYFGLRFWPWVFHIPPHLTAIGPVNYLASSLPIPLSRCPGLHCGLIKFSIYIIVVVVVIKVN